MSRRRTLHPALGPLRRRVFNVRHHGAYRRLLTQCSRRMPRARFEWCLPQIKHHRRYALRWGKQGIVQVESF